MAALKRILETTSETGNFGGEDVYPDRNGVVLRPLGEDRIELAALRWGFPETKAGSRPITNIRNLKSAWWRNVNGEYLLKPEHRCLVPFTAFAEPPRSPIWFGLPDQEVAFFAGIWRP
nr:hypothetical protein [Parvularcula bermudensis]